MNVIGFGYCVDVGYCDEFVGCFGWCCGGCDVVEEVVVFVIVDDKCGFFLYCGIG